MTELIKYAECKTCGKFTSDNRTESILKIDETTHDICCTNCGGCDLILEFKPLPCTNNCDGQDRVA